jgi:hypothetical protein
MMALNRKMKAGKKNYPGGELSSIKMNGQLNNNTIIAALYCCCLQIFIMAL